METRDKYSKRIVIEYRVSNRYLILTDLLNVIMVLYQLLNWANSRLWNL